MQANAAPTQPAPTTGPSDDARVNLIAGEAAHQLQQDQNNPFSSAARMTAAPKW